MARPQKRGLDYFSFDVDLYEDLKIGDLSNEFGPLGESIYTRILCLVYRDGYCLEIEMDRLAIRLIKSIGNRWVRSKEAVIQVILYCADIGLFHKDLLSQGVITSVGIQRRYLKAKGRRPNILKHWLLDENGEELYIDSPKTPSLKDKNPSYSEITPSFDQNNPTKKRKENKSKEKKNIIGDFDRFWDAYPRKVAKGAAEASWKKINPSEHLLQEMLNAIDTAKQSQQWTKDNGQYIPNPVTWLNQKRWEDQPEPEITKQPAPIDYDNRRMVKRGNKNWEGIV